MTGETVTKIASVAKKAHFVRNDNKTQKDAPSQ